VKDDAFQVVGEAQLETADVPFWVLKAFPATGKFTAKSTVFGAEARILRPFQ
jgi:hypothetical protein